MLKEYIPIPNAFNVPNSVHLMKDLADIPCVTELRLASLDILNMYSNIPTKELLNIMEITCKNNRLEPALIQEVLRITNLITTQNYFKFQDKTYLKMNGLAKTSPHFFYLIRILLTTPRKHQYIRHPLQLKSCRIFQVCQ